MAISDIARMFGFGGAAPQTAAASQPLGIFDQARRQAAMQSMGAIGAQLMAMGAPQTATQRAQGAYQLAQVMGNAGGNVLNNAQALLAERKYNLENETLAAKGKYLKDILGSQNVSSMFTPAQLSILNAQLGAGDINGAYGSVMDIMQKNANPELVKLGKGDTAYVRDPSSPTGYKLVMGATGPVDKNWDEAKFFEDINKTFNADNRVKTFPEAQRAAISMEQSAKIANQGGPQQGANDIALVYSFFKAIDPTSTVREGEFANAANAMGLPGQLVASLQKLQTGGFLTPEVRAALVAIAKNKVASQQEDISALADDYNLRLSEYGINPRFKLSVPRIAPSLGDLLPGVSSVTEN